MQRNTCLTRMHPADAIHQCFPRDVFQQIAFGACLNRAVDIFVAIEGCQHNNARILIVLADLLDRADPIELRHSQVEERHIGTMLFPKIHCFAAITGFANNSHVWFTLDQRSQTFPHNAVVVGDQNSNARSFLGTFVGTLRCGLQLPERAAPTSFTCGFYFWFHDTDCSIKGKVTMTSVPSPRALVTFSVPPICSARSCMPVKPSPSCRALTLNPSPSSRSSRRSSFALKINLVSKFRGRAYLRALVSASCPMCRRFSCQTSGRWRIFPRRLKLV